VERYVVVHEIIAGLKEDFVRPSAQLFAEIDDIWDKRLKSTDRQTGLET
jgi:hypothetical protein